MDIYAAVNRFRSEWKLPDDFLINRYDNMKAELTALPFFGEWRDLGPSRAGNLVPGMKIGTGIHTVTITAGAHADEPAGPRTAWGLAAWLAGKSDLAAEFRDRFTFLICPQVNPDGAVANSPWFAETPDPATYLQNVVRELPGDDIEFGYPGRGKGALRPENAAVADFLAEAAPAVVYHASLHSMGYAHGAWFLIGKNHADTTRPLQQLLARLAITDGYTLHDIDRRGDKGFTRIAPGFCTTPESEKMRDHFLALHDTETADKFHCNSMELARALGKNPLVMVSELPVFSIDGGWHAPTISDPKSIRTDTASAAVTHITKPVDLSTPPPLPGSTRYEQFRSEFAQRKIELTGAEPQLRAFLAEWDITPIPFAAQCKIQASMVIAGALYSLQL